MKSKKIEKLLGKNKKFVLLIFFTALIIRLVFILFEGNFINPEMYEHGLVARNMIQGHGFSMNWQYPTESPGKLITLTNPPVYEGAMLPPLNPLLIFAVLRIFGETVFSYALLMIINAIFSSLTCVLIYYLVLRFASGRSAKISAIVSIFFLPNIYGIITFGGPALYQLSALCFIFLGIKSVQEPNYKNFALLGIVGGLWTLQRGEILGFSIIFLVVIAFFVFRRNRQVNKILLVRFLSITFLILIIIPTPWLIRNAIVFHKPIGMNSHPWFEFWRGNNDFASGGVSNIYGDKNWPSFKYFPNLINRLDSLPDDQNLELAIDSIYKEDVMIYWKDHPQQALINMVKRGVYLWTVDTTTPRTFNFIYILSILYILIPFIVGSVYFFISSIKLKNFSSFSILFIVILVYSFSISVVNIEPRYQVYFYNFLIPITGIGWNAVWEKYQSIKAKQLLIINVG